MHSLNQLTMKSGSWMPRLERMAKSRNLCTFEKNVLLTLIGFVIQPNKVCIVTAVKSVLIIKFKSIEFKV